MLIRRHKENEYDHEKVTKQNDVSPQPKEDEVPSEVPNEEKVERENQVEEEPTKKSLRKK